MKRILLLCMMACCLFSCSKQDKKDEISVVGKWKMTSAISSVPINWYRNGVLTTDLFSGEKDCSKDDIYVFYKDGKYEVNQGAIQCNNSNSYIHTEGTWTLRDNKLILAFDEEFVNCDILQLDAKILKVSNETDWYGTPYTATRTLERQ